MKGHNLKDSRRLAWQPQQQQQQQQQDTSESASSSTRKLVQRVERVEREKLGNPTDKPELPSARKLERSTESLVEKKLELKVNLRIEGIAQHVILKYEER